MYDADVSAALISKVTDRVLEQVVQWQARPLESVYPIVYLDCIVLKSVTITVSSTNPFMWRWA